MTRPRPEALFVFSTAIVLSVVIGVAIGGVPGHSGQPHLTLIRHAGTPDKRTVVADAQPVAAPASETVRHAPARSVHRRASHAPHAAAQRSHVKRRATRRKPAARRHQRSRKPAVVTRTRSVSSAPRTIAPQRSAPVTRTVPVRVAPTPQPAPAPKPATPVRFNETGTSPSTGGGTVQFDDSGSGSTPTP